MMGSPIRVCGKVRFRDGIMRDLIGVTFGGDCLPKYHYLGFNNQEYTVLLSDVEEIVTSDGAILRWQGSGLFGVTLQTIG